MSRLFNASVAENRQLIENHFLLTIQTPENTIKPEPGNFYMLSVDAGLDPLLKRPLSIHSFSDNTLRFLYRVAGRGTGFLSRKKPGEHIELLGPLGNCFPVQKKEKKPLMIAGGIGIAPVFALIKELSDRSPLLFYGARTKGEILCLDELKEAGVDPVISTEDGSMGEKGNIVDVLNYYTADHSLPITDYSIYACGPRPMLKSVSEFTAVYDTECYAALEQNMACGLGTCLGCTVNTIHGYKRVCKEGPVFPVGEIIWDK